MNFIKLSNNKLIQFCYQHPDNRVAWLEFYKRFDRSIQLYVYRECHRRGISEISGQFEQIHQDLVQEVYMKLVEKDCKGLGDFVGSRENSIYTYLAVIVKNVVLNFMISVSAKKRISIKRSIEDPISFSGESSELLLKDTIKIQDSGIEAQFDLQSLRDRIEAILYKTHKGKHMKRNCLIFKLYFYEGFTPLEIASHFLPDISVKRINNILCEMKNTLREKLL